MSNAISIDKIKEIISEILYIDDIEAEARIFTDLDLSSIDFIDLCFELKKECGSNVEPDLLWPFNKMASNPELFSNNQWTDNGWKEVCSIINESATNPKESVSDLYKRFTPNFIQKRLAEIL